MESSLTRFKKVKRAKHKLNELFQRRKSVLLIHYSCESFVDNTKGSHKVTSIAVRNFDTGQTNSFSIFQCAEELGKQDSIDEHFNEIEAMLLGGFFEFVKEHKNMLWVHWNMRDINYGFAALEHRFKALGGEPIVIEDHLKYDMPRILYERYGKRYAPHPRLTNVVKMNKITDKNFLTGQEESQAFTKGQYLKLHQSTLRKVDIFDCILTRLEENDFKVASSFWEIYGISPEAVFKTVKENWVVAMLSIVLLVVGIIKLVLQFLGGEG